MCGIACYLGSNKEEGRKFGINAAACLKHRGPDDNGIYEGEDVTLAHTRLSILELSELGHQPMLSSCGRYTIVYNGEIYNHLELRKKYLPQHPFRGHSDTETIVELFRLKKEQMPGELVGMWAMAIWDNEEKKLFISRSRMGQKPLYVRRRDGAWLLASEMKALLKENEHPEYDATAVVEYLALGNYGHLGKHTFFKDIWQFPEGSFAWLQPDDTQMKLQRYWQLPDIRHKDKVPFTEDVKKKLHDIVVEAVLSQTLSDVPIGITLSGGIDSSIVAGILGCHYGKETHIFTAQSPNSKYDETRYVDAVADKYAGRFIIHRADLDEFSLQDNLEKYVSIQEEPFGDPSILAHGFLMSMAAGAGIKVILNGQGADELFFGYNNMAQAVLAEQLKRGDIGKFRNNINAMHPGMAFFARTLLIAYMPGIEFSMRRRSRIKRRNIVQPEILNSVDNSLATVYNYKNIYNVWQESLRGVHIPHLVHYDDRNAMAHSIEGRMPFLDHRIAEFAATIRPDEFLKNGRRKFILREACRQYLPDAVYNRTDKVGFYTPLVNMLYRDEPWVMQHLLQDSLITAECRNKLQQQLAEKTLATNDALQIWRTISLNIWMKEYHVNIN